MTRGTAAGIANGWLDGSFGSTAYLKIHIGDPGSAGTANPSAGDATRKSITLGASSGGVKNSTAAASPWTSGASGTETITDASVWTASTGGTFLQSFALSSTVQWANGNTITATSFSTSVQPIAA